MTAPTPSEDNADGFNADDYSADGFNAEGYDVSGFNADGYNEYGYNADGYDADGYDEYGYNADGYDADGYDADGYDADGYNADGYNADGYDADGYDADGYNEEGYDRSGRDVDNYNRDGEFDCGGCGDPECQTCHPVDARGQDEAGRYPYHYHDRRDGHRPLFAHLAPVPYPDGGAEAALEYSPDAAPLTPYLGMELEIELGEMPNDTARTLSKEAEALGLLPTTDGSLSHGVELVSQPSTLGVWMAPGYRKRFATLTRRYVHAGARSYNTSTCGVHIHVSRSAFLDRVHEIRFQLAVYGIPDIARTVSRRQPAQERQWAKLDSVREMAEREGSDIVRVVTNKTHGDWVRYEAVNITARTLEIRLFRGTLNIDSLMAYLQYVDALYHWTRGLTDSNIAHHREALLDWLDQPAQRASYPDLTALLIRRSVLTTSPRQGELPSLAPKEPAPPTYSPIAGEE